MSLLDPSEALQKAITALRYVEWSAEIQSPRRRGQVALVWRCCPVCDGIQPRQDGFDGWSMDPKAYFAEEWIDHQMGCVLKEALSYAEIDGK